MENIENFYFDMQINLVVKVKAPCYGRYPLCHYTWPILTKSILTTGGQMFTTQFYWTEKELWEMITEQSILVSQEWHEEWLHSILNTSSKPVHNLKTHSQQNNLNCIMFYRWSFFTDLLALSGSSASTVFSSGWKRKSSI